jgi:hypothetical protein
MMADFLGAIADLRLQHYRQAEGAARLQSAEEMLQFINETGFCLLSPRKGIELPNVRDIADGSLRHWKDDLFNRRLAYYGRPFRRRLGFVRLDLLPCIYALSPTADFLGDRFELFKRRYLSAEANRVAGVVMAKGPLSTRALRRECGMASRQHRHRFLRALFEAESRFLIVKSGITNVEVSHYSYLWESFEAIFPQTFADSLKIGVDAAARRLIMTYLSVVCAATIQQIAAAFTLNPHFVRYQTDYLEEGGMLTRHTEDQEEFLVDPQANALL